jgi:hypothetical protein
MGFELLNFVGISAIRVKPFFTFQSMPQPRLKNHGCGALSVMESTTVCAGTVFLALWN